MSEYQQVLACFLTVRRWFDSLRESNEHLALCKLWAEAQLGQDANDGKQARQRDGVQEELVTQNTVVGNLKEIHPPGAWRDGNARPVASLRLEDVGSTPRSLVLHLRECYLQVHILSHVLCQPLTCEQWAKVARVPLQDRGFKFALILDFGDAGVLLFMRPISQYDFKYDWLIDVEELSGQCPDVYTDYDRFLQGVATWIRRSHDSAVSRSERLATTAILQAPSVFGGMGPYTLIEVFFMAGLSPLLTEDEVFKCPSRSARLCEAFWSFAHEAHTALPAMLEACYDGFVLAPSVKQRLEFCQKLRIYGQRLVSTSQRTCQLAQRYEKRIQSVGSHPVINRNAIGGFFDVFEPTYVQTALRKQGLSPNLSPLVFGPIEWEINGDAVVYPCDPLTAVFRDLGYPPDGPTNLDLSRYRSQRFLSMDEMNKAQLPCYLYTGHSSPIPLWTITHQIPSGSDGDPTADHVPPVLHLEIENDQMLGENIIQRDNGNFVGPLEHCEMRSLARRESTSPQASQPTPSHPQPARLNTVKFLDRRPFNEASPRKAGNAKRKSVGLSLDFHIVQSPAKRGEGPEPGPSAKRHKAHDSRPIASGSAKLPT